MHNSKTDTSDIDSTSGNDGFATLVTSVLPTSSLHFLTTISKQDVSETERYEKESSNVVVQEGSGASVS